MELSHIIRGGGGTFTGYCPRNSRALEPIKKLLLWGFSKNGGAHCVMALGVMQRVLRERFGCEVCIRTIEYALKRLRWEGFISRQTRWRKLPDGRVRKFRTVTRPKGRLMREQLDRGLRGLRLMAQTWHPNGGEIVQKIAAGYSSYLKTVLPRRE